MNQRPRRIAFGILAVLLALGAGRSLRIHLMAASQHEPDGDDRRAIPAANHRAPHSTAVAVIHSPDKEAPTTVAIGEEYFGRDPKEWQGYLVQRDRRAHCAESQYCSLALACRDDGICGPCTEDAHCRPGERCVLDHCLIADRVGCRSRADCPDGLCVFEDSGRSTFRGNEELSSRCLTPGEPREAFDNPRGTPTTRPIAPIDDADRMTRELEKRYAQDNALP